MNIERITTDGIVSGQSIQMGKSWITPKLDALSIKETAHGGNVSVPDGMHNTSYYSPPNGPTPGITGSLRRISQYYGSKFLRIVSIWRA